MHFAAWARAAANVARVRTAIESTTESCCLVKRVQHPRDARSRIVVIEPRWTSRLVDAHNALRDVDHAAVRGFTADEVRVLHDLLRRLDANLDETAGTETANPSPTGR